MTYQEFVDKWNNVGCDFDGAYGFQCMDLAHQYAQDVVGHDFPPAPAAKDVWDFDLPDYDKIANTPDGVPTKGDIMIWGTGVGAFGHIAVFDHGDQNTFTSFDQNWPLNSLCHYQNHNYNGVLGWFHPKSAIIAQPTPQLTLQTIIPKTLLDGEDADLEIQQIAGLLKDGKRDNLDLANTRTENEQLKQELKICQDQPIFTPSNPSQPIVYSWGGLFDYLAHVLGKSG